MKEILELISGITITPEQEIYVLWTAIVMFLLLVRNILNLFYMIPKIFK